MHLQRGSCKHQQFLLNVCHESDFLHFYWSVPPEQELRKIAYILIGLAFSTEIFFFFCKLHIYSYLYIFTLYIFTVSKYISNIFSITKVRSSCTLTNNCSLFCISMCNTDSRDKTWVNSSHKYI